MEYSPSVTNYYRSISMRIFHLSNVRRRIPRMNNEHVNLYSEETNVETNAGLVVHLYRIVPNMHSALFSTLYMGKDPQMLTSPLRLKKNGGWLSIAVLTAASS